ncbi:molecular chaperone DnaJ [Halobacteriales archaeon QS_3_64_16]|nr:MAG: molecular chaperone DnaJ [Halobacteriales archaeon QS_3_64_16]
MRWPACRDERVRSPELWSGHREECRDVLNAAFPTVGVLAEVLDALARLEWLALGTLLGIAFTMLAAGAFLLGGKLFPTASRDDRTGGTQEARNTSESGETRRRTEIRQYLRAIDEPFAEDHPVGAETVAFYLPERDVAITFDPRTYYRIERSRSYGVLAEHEMPGFQLGARLPFETPAVTEAATDPAEAAFAVLGIPSGASTEEIKAAYRRKVKEVHPDQGGDRESFRRVRDAYTAAREDAG